MFMFAQVAQQHLTLRDILTGLPHDPASIVGYVFIVVIAGFFVVGMRRPAGTGAPASPAAGTDAAGTKGIRHGA
jgi:hypothetical protein